MRLDARPDVHRGRPGQCELCGSFRTDGRPVTVHFTGCAAGPDASVPGVLWVRSGPAYVRAEIEPAAQERPVKRVKGRRVQAVHSGPTIPEAVPIKRGTWRRR